MNEEDGVDFRQFSMTVDEYAAMLAIDSIELLDYNAQCSDQLFFDFQF